VGSFSPVHYCSVVHGRAPVDFFRKPSSLLVRTPCLCGANRAVFPLTRVLSFFRAQRGPCLSCIRSVCESNFLSPFCVLSMSSSVPPRKSSSFIRCFRFFYPSLTTRFPNPAFFFHALLYEEFYVGIPSFPPSVRRFWPLRNGSTMVG